MHIAIYVYGTFRKHHLKAPCYCDTSSFSFENAWINITILPLICRKMKLDLDREKGLELFSKFIRTKNVDSLQGDQSKTGPEPLHPADSKQKLQVMIIVTQFLTLRGSYTLHFLRGYLKLKFKSAINISHLYSRRC